MAPVSFGLIILIVDAPALGRVLWSDTTPTGRFRPMGALGATDCNMSAAVR